MSAELSPEQVEALAEALCADTTWEHHDQTDDHPCSRCKRQAYVLLAPTVAAMIAERERALRERIETVLAARAGDGKFVIIGGVRAALATPTTENQ